MPSSQGIQVLGDYTTGSPTNDVAIDRLIALIPDPDVSPAQSGGGFLDQMSPAAATQLLVELAALKTAVTPGEGEGYANGTYAAIAGDDTANETTIDSGLTTDAAFTTLIVDIIRAGVSVKADAIVTDNEDGTFTVADGAATYDVTAGDSIRWFAEV